MVLSERFDAGDMDGGYIGRLVTARRVRRPNQIRSDMFIVTGVGRNRDRCWKVPYFGREARRDFGRSGPKTSARGRRWKCPVDPSKRSH